MSLKKDKAKVLGEFLDDERIKTFLEVPAVPGGMTPDYVALERAYRGMNTENFASFVGFFVEAGKDLNATNAQGKTLLEVVRQHRHGGAYADILAAAGAQ